MNGHSDGVCSTRQEIYMPLWFGGFGADSLDARGQPRIYYISGITTFCEGVQDLPNILHDPSARNNGSFLTNSAGQQEQITTRNTRPLRSVQIYQPGLGK